MCRCCRIRYCVRSLELMIRERMREFILSAEAISLLSFQELADQTGGVAFAMYPTSMEDLMAIADENKLMPPKSTWFEPKLRSGLFIHKLS